MENDNERCDYGDSVNSIQNVVVCYYITRVFYWNAMLFIHMIYIILPDEVHFILHRINLNCDVFKNVAFSTHFDVVKKRKKKKLTWIREYCVVAIMVGESEPRA